MVRKGLITVAVAGVGLIMLPGSAPASTVAISGTTLKATDPLNVAQATTVNFTAATATFGVTDGGGAMTAVAPCVVNGAGTAVQCPSAGVTQIFVDGAGGIDDIIIDPSVPTGLQTLLRGGAGPDVLTGGGGNDILEGGAGADTYFGAVGIDSVSYASHPAGPGVRVRVGTGPVSGNGFDGGPGARDQITNSVEGVIGTGSNDVVAGNSSANVFRGVGGLDKMVGRGGADRLFGGAKRDVLRGGNGPDRIDGGPGRDFLSGQNGSDKLFANDGEADGVIDCGNGAGEFASVDALDPAPVSC